MVFKKKSFFFFSEISQSFHHPCDISCLPTVGVSACFSVSVSLLYISLHFCDLGFFVTINLSSFIILSLFQLSFCMRVSMDSRVRGQETHRQKDRDSIIFPRRCAYGFRTMDRILGAWRNLSLSLSKGGQSIDWLLRSI